MWGGVWKLLLGKKGHANWHFTDESRPRPSPMAMFIVRSENPAWFEVLAWRLEESTLRAFMRLIAPGRRLLRRPAPEEEEDEEKEDGSEESAETAGRKDRLRKRLCASAGLFGIYLTWTIMCWFIFTCACEPLHALTHTLAC